MKQVKLIILVAFSVGMLLLNIPGYSQNDPCAKGHTADLEKGLCAVCNALTYSIGATGPGGGKIFYRNAAGFTVQAGPGFSVYQAHYLEAAPNGWKGGASDPTLPFAASNDEIPNMETIGISTWKEIGGNIWQLSQAVLKSSIGQGRKSTALIIQRHGSNAPAVKSCSDYRGPRNKSDWFLPSIGELFELYKQRGLSGINLTGNWYWSSTQCDNDDDKESVWDQDFDMGGQSYHSKDCILLVRAIRAF
jgi:hypothetical protein